LSGSAPSLFLDPLQYFADFTELLQNGIGRIPSNGRIATRDRFGGLGHLGTTKYGGEQQVVSERQ